MKRRRSRRAHHPPEETPEWTLALRYRVFVVDTPGISPQTLDFDE